MLIWVPLVIRPAVPTGQPVHTAPLGVTALMNKTTRIGVSVLIEAPAEGRSGIVDLFSRSSTCCPVSSILALPVSTLWNRVIMSFAIQGSIPLPVCMGVWRLVDMPTRGATSLSSAPAPGTLAEVKGPEGRDVDRRRQGIVKVGNAPPLHALPTVTIITCSDSSSSAVS